MKAFVTVLVLFCLILGFGCAEKEKKPAEEGKPALDLKGKKILMVIAHKDFRDEEYQTPRQVIEKLGAEMTVASSSLEKAMGMLGLEVKPDILLKDVKAVDYDALVFVGGPGSKEYWDDSLAHKLIKEAYDEGKVLGAICIAPVTLANAGILRGKKVTAFRTVADKLRSTGAIYSGEDVVVTGRIVTASGPKAAEGFAMAIARLALLN